jgi:hypothetical protein
MLKLLKKIGLVAILIAGIVAVSLWQPWKYITNISLIGSNSALTVNSTAGKSEVYLDDEKIGETPFSTENLSPGDYSLEVKRVTDEDNFYTTISKQIHIETNTRTLFEVEIGPSQQFSSYALVYYRKNESNETSLYIDTDVPQAEISLNDKTLGPAPAITEKMEAGDYIIKVTAPGYEEYEVEVIARKGYTLIAEMDLMIKPISIE